MFTPQRKTWFGYLSWIGGFGIYIVPERFSTREKALDFIEKKKINRNKINKYTYIIN